MNSDMPTAGGPAKATQSCPRCGGKFHCGMHEASPCACSRLKLQASHLAALRATYTGCLCLRCLQAVAAGQGVAQP